ncbi:hypothetical protein OIV83_002001 [Microbotryomycetes sp. JL201]|nr:hypothetical protein OIV83_002001 [Microbotryomycetes sp. JL201]
MSAPAQDVLAPPVQDSISLGEATVRSGTSSTAAAGTSSRPDAHTQRYDRQLRLWASSGQSALENAHILVINGSATGSSTLKNLVLPGVGQFTIIDDAKVEASDIGNNFFLETTSLGKSRAEEVTRLLLELNETVKGNAVVKNLDELASSPEKVLAYTLIIAVDAEPTSLLKISDTAWQHDIPVIKVRSCGFYGSLRTQIGEFPIVETHPESLIDLRIHSPFPELVEYANSIDYSKMDSAEFSHVPAVIVLVKAMEAWKTNHDGQVPQGSAERQSFIKDLTALKRKSDDENIDEAVTLFRRAGTKANHSSSAGLLPLSGALPDMHADSKGYVKLQTLYKTKARQDLQLVNQLLSELCTSIGIVDPRLRFSDDQVETFVKHSAFLKVVRGRSLRQELEKPLIKGRVDEIKMQAQFGETPDDSLSVHIGLTASERFYQVNGRYPGTSVDDLDGTKDVKELGKLAKDVLDSFEGGEPDEELEKVVAEICRAGAADLPQMAALLGGMVAQEAIKLITKQYVPLNGTCIVNGIRSTTSILQG